MSTSNQKKYALTIQDISAFLWQHNIEIASKFLSASLVLTPPSNKNPTPKPKQVQAKTTKLKEKISKRLIQTEFCSPSASSSLGN